MGVLNMLPDRIRKERELIGRFRETAASTPEMARPLAVIHPGITGLPSTLRSLVRKGIVRKMPLEDRYFLDEKKLLQHRMNRVKWGFILLFLILGLIFLVLPGLR